MARTTLSPIPGEVHLTDGSNMADPVVAAMEAASDDAILRRIVKSVAYSYDDPEIRAASGPRLELDTLRAAARELLRRAAVTSRAARTAKRDEELRLP